MKRLILGCSARVWLNGRAPASQAGCVGSIPITRSRHDCRGVEQLVARRAHNPKVAGSSPAPATNRLTLLT